MKYRDYKENAENTYFHVYNRGNRRENIFLDDEDYLFFILRLRQNIDPDATRPKRMQVYPENSFSLLSYSLLPNHFHFLIRQNTDIPIGKLMLKIGTSYAIYFNKKYNKVGHVFQGEFKQRIVDNDSYLKWLSAYIHQNSVLHGVVQNAKDYKWSSYKEYLNFNNIDNLCQTNILLEQFKDLSSFLDFTEKNLLILKENKNIRKFCLD